VQNQQQDIVALSQSSQPAIPRGVVFHARDLSKTYTMGEVQVHALRDVNLDIYEGEFVVLLGPPARASRPCSTSWAASTRRPAAKRDGATTTSSAPTTPN
jgi:hypothetical protein